MSDGRPLQGSVTLRARVALWTFVTALLVAATLTTISALEARRFAGERLRAEGRRIAVAAVTLYDVLRLTGAEADRATLRTFLRATVRGTSSAERLAWAVVLDERDRWVAGEVAWDVVEEPARDDPQRLPRGRPHIVAVEARVLSRDAAGDGAELPSGRVLVGISTRTAEAALTRALLASGALSFLAAAAFAAALFSVLTRRVVRPVARVVEGIGALKAGRFDVVVPDLGGRDEAAALTDGFNDLVTSLVEKEKLRSALARHVGAKLADDVADLPVGTGRRLRVTALFLDVEGFAAHTGRMAPEQVVAFLQELVALCVEVVHAHDGHVAKVTGDSLLAVWGVPEARADDALRATRAAFSLWDRCQRLSEERRLRGAETFAVGVGVATGEAVIASVGNAKRAEAVVAGEVVALARSIEEEAKALGFGVLLAEETFRAVDKDYEGAPSPPVLMKDIGMPLTLYRVRPRRRP
jgi:class 3 adenylate cyclase